METYNTSTEKRLRAQEQVGKIKSFYGHLAIYLLFVIFFISLNVFTGGFPWAIFPIAGWGIGVAGQALDTFGKNPFFSRDWEQRKLKELMRDDSF